MTTTFGLFVMITPLVVLASSQSFGLYSKKAAVAKDENDKMGIFKNNDFQTRAFKSSTEVNEDLYCFCGALLDSEGKCTSAECECGSDCECDNGFSLGTDKLPIGNGLWIIISMSLIYMYLTMKKEDASQHPL